MALCVCACVCVRTCEADAHFRLPLSLCVSFYFDIKMLQFYRWPVSSPITGPLIKQNKTKHEKKKHFVFVCRNRCGFIQSNSHSFSHLLLSPFLALATFVVAGLSVFLLFMPLFFSNPYCLGCVNGPCMRIECDSKIALFTCCTACSISVCVGMGETIVQKFTSHWRTKLGCSNSSVSWNAICSGFFTAVRNNQRIL